MNKNKSRCGCRNNENCSECEITPHGDIELITPSYYLLSIDQQQFDVFDLVRAINDKQPLSFELASALKYIIRLKKDTKEKRINDLEKAIECIKREIKYLNKL